MSATLEGVRRAEGFFVGVVAIDEGRTGVVVNTELPEFIVDTRRTRWMAQQRR